MWWGGRGQGQPVGSSLFLGSAQVSGMAKQGLYLTWMSPLTFLQHFRTNLLRDE